MEVGIRIHILQGDDGTGEREAFQTIKLLPYREVFAKKYPHLPPISEGFEDQYSIEEHILHVDDAEISLSAHYSVRNNSIHMIVKHKQTSLVQVSGQAIDTYGNGLSVIVRVPESEILVDFTVEDRYNEPKCQRNDK